jgi:hypothetical protein
VLEVTIAEALLERGIGDRLRLRMSSQCRRLVDPIVISRSDCLQFVGMRCGRVDGTFRTLGTVSPQSKHFFAHPIRFDLSAVAAPIEGAFRCKRLIFQTAVLRPQAAVLSIPKFEN